MTLPRPWIKFSPWMLVFIFSLGYIFFSLAAHHWDPFSFVLIGGKYDPHVNNPFFGYDGQFAYQIARDPMNGWKYLDVPAYRYQRILYPLLSRLLALGNDAALPWTLILVNLVCLVVGTWVLERLLVAHRQNPWYALGYGLFAGLLVSLRLDLTEPLAFLLVLVGLREFERNRWFLSAGLFVLAAFTREVTLVFAAACFLCLVMNRKIRLGLAWGAAVAVPFLVWQFILWLWFGTLGINPGGAMSNPAELIPFHGWWGYAAVNPVDFWVKSLLVVPTVILPTLAALWIAIRSFWQGFRGIAEWGLLLNVALISVLPRSIILDPLGMLRTLIGLMTAVVFFGLKKPSARALNYAMLWLALLVFIALDSFIPAIP